MEPLLLHEDFGKTIGWQIKEGRDFSKEFATDSLAMILNESAVKQIGMKNDIVGQTIQFNDKNYHVDWCDKRYDHGIAI